MEVLIGNAFEKYTFIDTGERNASLALDKGDRACMVLGTNRVDVFYTTDGGWCIRCSKNVSVQIVKDDDLHVGGAPLREVHEKAHSE